MLIPRPTLIPAPVTIPANIVSFYFPEATDDAELLAGRAFPETQRLLASPALRRLSETSTVGWHGAATSPAEPAFALVRRGGPLDNNAVGDDEGVIGEVLILTRTGGDDPIYVYCLGAADLPTDISVTLRAFIALAVPTAEQIECLVAVAT